MTVKKLLVTGWLDGYHLVRHNKKWAMSYLVMALIWSVVIAVMLVEQRTGSMGVLQQMMAAADAYVGVSIIGVLSTVSMIGMGLYGLIMYDTSR
ncbi:hypothetical protein [uncultured Veillonella sp.]|uniref:hypothetical protein n=1 Tax=uncultured Veillonella sp. TaxID=159268 RepID=UPI0025859101|nr:hypothetical protein [uncultured Veillonella sp.]